MTHLIEGFKRNFKVIPAHNQELIEQSLVLRYQVYCVEKAFEASAVFEDGKETDAYDARSVHSLVYHRGLRQHVGSVRLVLPDNNDPEVPFPVERLCRSLHRDRLRLSTSGRIKVAEISRFAISKQRRGSMPGPQGPVSPNSTLDSTILPHATLGLFTAIVRMSADHGVTHWYALMEPTLRRLLSRFGIYFERVGPAVQHRGTRQPVMADVDALLARGFLERPDVWGLATDFGRTWCLNESLLAELRASQALSKSGTWQRGSRGAVGGRRQA